jgi:FkbM family methyltransferase
MKQLIKKFITSHLAHRHIASVHEYYHKLLEFGQISYSQEGEDMLVAEILGHQATGFYVDIGAHHPKRYSNTYHFYLKGWLGINADAAPGSMKEFATLRPRDINLEIGIAAEAGTLEFYMFSEPGLNTLDYKRMLEISQIPAYHLVAQVQVQTVPLAKLLDQHLPAGTKIDFLNIDVEGLDYSVLMSNNWDKYKPRLILVEHYVTDLEAALKSQIYQLLIQQGYVLRAKTYRNLIFERL